MGFIPAVKAFFATSAIWAAVKAIATVAYVIYLWRQYKKANQSPTYGFDIQTQSSNELPIPVVYGKVKAAGNIVWQRMSYDKSKIYAFVAFSEGPIEGFEDVRANDIPISKLPGCSYTAYLGTPDQVIDERCPGGVSFFEDRDYKGKVVTLSAGNYTAADLVDAGMVYKRTESGRTIYFGSWLSSVKVNHHKVTLYSGENFDGHTWVLTEDNPRLSTLTPDANDRVYSIKIEPLTYADRAKIVGGLRHVAYIAFTIKAGDKISGGMPNFTAIVKGRKVRVWENESWITKWTENPVWHLLDLLTHTRYGGGYTDSQINIEGFKTAAAFCDEILSDGRPRFTEGIIIDWVDSLPDIVDQIRFTCRGYVVSYNGKLTFKIEQPETPCQHFSMENIVEDSLEIYMPGKDEEWQKTTVTYCEPNQNWAKLPAQSVDESNPLHPIQKDFTIVGVNRFSQASRLAYFYRVYSKYCRFSGKFKTTIRALNRIPGDVITISDDIMGWVKKPVRILEIRHAGDHGHEIYFREYNETIYNDALGSAEPTVNYSELPNPFSPANDPTDLVLTENTYVLSSGEVVPEIIVTFNPAYSMFYKYSLIQISEDGVAWQDYGQTYEGNYKIHGIRIGQEYWIRVKTVFDKVSSDGAVASIKMVGKNQPPGDLKGLTVVQQENILKVSVIPPDDPDLNKFELRVGGLSWETSSYLKQFKDNQTTVDVTQAGTQTFWAKAIDNSGNYSDNAVSFVAAIYPISNKFTIHEEHQDGRNWTPKCMFWDRNGWQIDSVEKLGDLEFFAQMFDIDYHLCEDAEIILDVVDLGETITSTNYVETFLSVFAEYDASDKNYIDIDYRTSWDGIEWSDWLPLINHQFAGRYVQPKLKPRSVDGLTNVNLRGATIRIDVTAITETVDFTDVAETGTTRIYLSHRFFNAPLPQLSSYSTTGMLCMHSIGEGFKKDVDGRWYVDVSCWMGETQIAGKISGSVKGY